MIIDNLLIIIFTFIYYLFSVCHSIDIRNKPDNLRILDNCTVIEGFLQILLIDQYDTSAFENYSFPKLVEVTDYVMLYRVNGLLTLRTLFPNLKVIRGNHIFENHALIIYEMLNLQVSATGLFFLY